MQIDILTLFPEMFEGFLTESIIKRAIEKEIVKINIINFRKYTTDPHGKVDDTPFGGGAGMVLQIEPIYNALMDIKSDDSHIILLTPSGKTFNQKKASKLSNCKHLILICGHYEGFDYRITELVDEEVCNPLKAWHDLGEPANPSQEQLELLDLLQRFVLMLHKLEELN